MSATIVYNFPTDSEFMGHNPQGNVTLSGSSMYGISKYGGIYGNAGATDYGYGVLFKVNLTTNIVTKLHDFGASSVPYAPGGTREDGMVFDPNVEAPIVIGSKLYGICGPITGGSGYKIYSINTDGTDYKLLYFTTNVLIGGLLSLNNLIYGFAMTGGTNGQGFIFSFNTTTNTLSTLYNFSSSTNTGPVGSLNGYLEGSNYVVYGTCFYYNSNPTPSLFKYNITTNTFTSVKVFSSTSGSTVPFNQVIFNSDNSKLYGVIGGSTNTSTIYSMNTNDLTGTSYALLHTFSRTDGTFVGTRLVLDGSVLYGSTVNGDSPSQYGNIFSINTNGTNFTIEYNFGSVPDAQSAFGICYYNSNIYGISYFGGTGTGKKHPTQRAGTVFSLGAGGGGAPCFTETTKILTEDGYKEIRHLLKEDKLVTADGRLTSFKLYHFRMNKTDNDSAPYCVPASSLGESYPETDLHISGLHAIQDKNGLWQFPMYLKKTNPLIKQFNIGKPITYYHIECPNYFNDNLIVEGCVVESFKNGQGKAGITYYWDEKQNGFIRNKEDEITEMPERLNNIVVYSN